MCFCSGIVDLFPSGLQCCWLSTDVMPGKCTVISYWRRICCIILEISCAIWDIPQSNIQLVQFVMFLEVWLEVIIRLTSETSLFLGVLWQTWCVLCIKGLMCSLMLRSYRRKWSWNTPCKSVQELRLFYSSAVSFIRYEPRWLMWEILSLIHCN